MILKTIGRLGGQRYLNNGQIETIVRSRHTIEKALKSIRKIPIVDGHNWIESGKEKSSVRTLGYVIDAFVQGDEIKGLLDISDSVAESLKGRGFSLGYEAERVKNEYINLVYNHLAIVDNPRCGDKCRVK